MSVDVGRNRLRKTFFANANSGCRILSVGYEFAAGRKRPLNRR